MRGIPNHDSVRAKRKGWGKSRTIRQLWGERCSFTEIAEWLRVDSCEISRTLRRPASYVFVNRGK